MRWLVTLAGVAAVTVAAVALVLAGDDGIDERSDRPAGPEPRPALDTALLAGSATRIDVDPTLLEPLTTPVTIVPVERGGASATISPVLVDGSAQAVAWPGGTPLVFEGGGTIILDPVAVTADAAGLTIHLDDVVGRLAPGPYRLTGSIAVGPSGLGRPADAVTFEATEATTVTFDGAATITRPPSPVTLEGPGSVRIEGDVEVTTAASDRRVTAVEFPPGPYRLDLVWVEDRIELDGRLQALHTVVEPGE